MILDVKDGLEACNARIGKQRVQYHDVEKLGYIMCLTMKVDVARWIEFFQEKWKQC